MSKKHTTKDHVKIIYWFKKITRYSLIKLFKNGSSYNIARTMTYATSCSLKDLQKQLLQTELYTIKNTSK